MTVTFVRTRHTYDSYNDLWMLVELADYPICYVDEIDASDAAQAYILPTRNGEWGNGWPDAKARLIHWNLEWDDYPPMTGIAETWHSDQWFAEHIGARYVPMGSDVRLCPNADHYNEQYDVAYMGYMIPRRERIWNELQWAGVKPSPIHAWGDERHRILRSSAAYLHVHQHDDKPGVPPLRMVVAAAYALPVITEFCADPGVFTTKALGYNYAELAENVKAAVADWEHCLLPYGLALRQFLCEDYTFAKSVEGAL